jgi:acetyltransferase-like isoleucine patch superfamily enzyme
MQAQGVARGALRRRRQREMFVMSHLLTFILTLALDPVSSSRMASHPRARFYLDWSRLRASPCVHHRRGPRPGGATIGDHVFIGCHSSVIGPVVVGDDALIAANSLIIDNVPAGFTAIGVPAKMLP